MNTINERDSIAPGRLTETRTRAWELTIPAPAKFMNLNDRQHWAVKAKLTRLWRTAARVHAQQARLPKGLGRVQVVVHVCKPSRRTYDVNNLQPTSKALVDGLVDYGLVVDDSNDFVVGPDMRRGLVGPSGVVLVITEIGSTKP